MIEIASFVMGWLAGILMTELGVIIAIKLINRNEEPTNKD